MERTRVLLEPSDFQTNVLDKMYGQSFHFRKQYYQEKMEAEVAEIEFDRGEFIEKYKEHVKEQYPGLRLNMNIFEAMADIIDMDYRGLKGYWTAFSRGIQLGQDSIWLPFLRVIRTAHPIGSQDVENGPIVPLEMETVDYVVISKNSETNEYDAELLWE